MRQHRTLFMLFLRQSAWKVLLILLAMAALEIALFAAFMPDPAAYSLETALIMTQRYLSVVVLIAFVLLSASLLSDGKGGYTLDRLALPPKTVLLWQSVYNILAYFLFWGVQVAVMLLLCRFYETQGGYVGPQTFYLACWQSELFHTFLPMDEWPRWARNLIFCAGFGITNACSSAQLRHKGKPIALMILVAGNIPLAVEPMGVLPTDILVIVEVSIITAVALFNALSLGKEANPDEEVPSA